MGDGRSRAELLCEALHAHGLSKDWYRLTATEQLALRDVADAFVDEAEIEEKARADVEEIESEIRSRGFGFHFDRYRDECFVFGDRELRGVVAWSADNGGGEDETKVRLIVQRTKNADALALIEQMKSAGVDVAIDGEASRGSLRRRFAFAIDGDGKARFFLGDRELDAVLSAAIRVDEGGKHVAKLAIVKDPKNAERESLICDMRDGGVEIDEIEQKP